MKSNIEKNNRLYEKPKFNKYGSMKYLVFASGGSGGDGMGSDTSDNNQDYETSDGRNQPGDVKPNDPQDLTFDPKGNEDGSNDQNSANSDFSGDN